MSIIFLDVGQGDAILIEAPNGNQMLVDAGPDARILHQLGSNMKWFDRTIDIAIGTHADEDHVGGFPVVFGVYEIKQFVMNVGQRGDELARILQEELISIGEELYQGDRLVLDYEHGVFVDVFWPPKDQEFSDRNDGSYALRISYGEISVMLTGDLSENIEEKITAQFGEKLSSTILKAGHHGSKTSTSQIFLSAVNPKYGIISAGKENRYGHPAEEILERLSNFGIEIYRTDEEGGIVFESDGKELVRK